MAKGKKSTRNWPRFLTILMVLLRFLAILIVVISVLGLIGAFGITTAGIEVFARFTAVMDKFAWTAPFLGAGLAFVLWYIAGNTLLTERDAQALAIRRQKDYPAAASQPRSTSRVQGQLDRRSGVRSNVRCSQDGELDKLPLPPGKLVTLRGFREYFDSPDWAEVKPPVQELNELGTDFSTYFGEGTRFAERIQRNLTTIRGFRNYFEQVQMELENERETMPPANPPPARKTELEPCGSRLEAKSTDTTVPTSEQAWSVPGQLARLVQRSSPNEAVPTASGGGVTPEERQVLLGKTNSGSGLGKVETSREETGRIYGSKILPLRGDAPGFALEGQDHTQKDKRLESKQPDGREGTGNSALGLEPGEATASEPSRIWHLPTLNLLDPLSIVATPADPETPKLLEGVLQDFGVKAKVIRVTRGPVITRYELAPAPGVKISKIVNLADDIALALAARDVRIEAPIPGKSAIGIEVPNKHPRTVPFREVVDTNTYRQNPSKLRVALGKDIADQAVIADLGKMPHLLVAGATGSGKSVCITALINSLLFNATPAEVKLLLVDPKMVELSNYNGVPHLLAPVVTDPQKAAAALKWIVKEMETRYELFAAAGVRDIERYNQVKTAISKQAAPTLPWIVVVIDELADLMLVAAADVEESICRLAQMARAAGIHLVIATQRPSVDVITGLIKANIPSRISFAVSSQIDSRTILDSVGAEKLLGKGDMLYSPQGLNKPVRVQGCFLSDDEVQRVIRHWQSQGRPEYLDPDKLFTDPGVKGENGGTPEDELFYEAGELLISTGMASVTFLQRRLKLGYARAARLMDQLEEQGVVGGYEGSKPRQVLLTLEEFRKRFNPET